MLEQRKVTRILIAGDHPIFREGLRNSFANKPEFQVVGEASDGNKALELVDELQPDILLLDLLEPRDSRMDILRSLSQSHSKVKTILLSSIKEREEITKAFDLGARGVVWKDLTTSLLFDSIRAAMAGRYWIDGQSVSTLTQTVRYHRSSVKSAKAKNYGLTPREMEVLRAVIYGHQNKEIARQFSISEHTVKHHIGSIFDKLGVYNRLELALFVFHHGIIEE